MKSLVGDKPSWHKEPINFFNKMLSIRKVRLLITSRYIAMQSYECVIISKMFLIYFISYGCNGGALVFLRGAEASASPSFALPMFITIKKIIILNLFLGVPAATVGGTGTPWHTRGYAPDTHTHTHTCTQTYTHTHTHRQTHIHTHTHTHTAERILAASKLDAHWINAAIMSRPRTLRSGRDSGVLRADWRVCQKTVSHFD